MAKRTQILLEDWQIAFIKRSAKVLDFSHSEIVRVLLCEGILSLHFWSLGKRKSEKKQKELSKMRKRALSDNTSAEERHKILSKVYFETRKATEHKFGGKI